MLVKELLRGIKQGHIEEMGDTLCKVIEGPIMELELDQRYVVNDKTGEERRGDVLTLSYADPARRSRDKANLEHAIYKAGLEEIMAVIDANTEAVREKRAQYLGKEWSTISAPMSLYDQGNQKDGNGRSNIH